MRACVGGTFGRVLRYYKTQVVRRKCLSSHYQDGHLLMRPLKKKDKSSACELSQELLKILKLSCFGEIKKKDKFSAGELSQELLKILKPSCFGEIIHLTIDIDECTGPHGCNLVTSKCKNLMGSYICECNAGQLQMTPTLCRGKNKRFINIGFKLSAL